MLDELYDQLKVDRGDGDPKLRLLEIANRYISFVHQHTNLWSTMFEHVMPNVPEWYHEKALRLLGLVTDAIEPLFGNDQDDALLHHAQVMWASLQGICSIQIAGKLVKKEAAQVMADSLISNYIAGLEQKHYQKNHGNNF